MFEKIKKFIQKDLQKKYEQLEQRFLIFEQKVYGGFEERMKNLENQFDYISELLREKNNEKNKENSSSTVSTDNSENEAENLEKDLSSLPELGKNMESKLHQEGIYSLSQIAEMTDVEIEALDEKIPGFKIRFQRNDWRNLAITILNEK